MGGPTGCGGIWVLFWWAGPCSVKFYPIFFDGWGCVPSLLFGLRPRYGRGNGDLLQKDLCQNTLHLPGLLYSVLLTPQQAIDNLHLCRRLLDTHTQVWLTHSLVGSLFLSSGFWCTQGFVCALQESFPHSCGILFCHKNISICGTMYGPKG